MVLNRVKIAFATKIAITGAAFVAGVGVAALSCTKSFAEGPIVSALVVKVATSCFASAVRFTGLVVPRAEAIVNLPDGYQISEVLVAEGDNVTAGHALAKLTRLSAPAAEQGGQGQGGHTQTGATSQQPAAMPLTAPAGGLISKSTAKVGAVAAAIPMGAEPLFRIIVKNELEIEADVPGAQLPKLNGGGLARVRLENGQDLTGHVRAVLPEIARKSQLGKVRLSFGNDPAIRAGMFARGTIDANSCGLSIPRSAVQYQTEGATVQVVRGTTVETRRVRLGLFSDADVEVREGVKEGELVIANAGSSLHDGDQVKPKFADDSRRSETR
jgi:HlyD family secretion protein